MNNQVTGTGHDYRLGWRHEAIKEIMENATVVVKGDRVISYENTVNAIGGNKQLSVENASFALLLEIAGSLAVIADALTEKKGGEPDTGT